MTNPRCDRNQSLSQRIVCGRFGNQTDRHDIAAGPKSTCSVCWFDLQRYKLAETFHERHEHTYTLAYTTFYAASANVLEDILHTIPMVCCLANHHIYTITYDVIDYTNAAYDDCACVLRVKPRTLTNYCAIGVHAVCLCVCVSYVPLAGYLHTVFRLRHTLLRIVRHASPRKIG